MVAPVTLYVAASVVAFSHAVVGALSVAEVPLFDTTVVPLATPVPVTESPM
jgi:hypothetical protein